MRIQLVGAAVAVLAGSFVVWWGKDHIEATVAGLALLYALQFTDALKYLVRQHATLEMQMNSVRGCWKGWEAWAPFVEEVDGLVLTVLGATPPLPPPLPPPAQGGVVPHGRIGGDGPWCARGLGAARDGVGVSVDWLAGGCSDAVVVTGVEGVGWIPESCGRLAIGHPSDLMRALGPSRGVVTNPSCWGRSYRQIFVRTSSTYPPSSRLRSI